MSALVLRLAGPLQSWGGYRHGVNKEATIPSAAMPRKSGISGLIGAAVGSRDLASVGQRFRLHARLDATNPVAEDLQTIGPLPGYRNPAEVGNATRTADRSVLVASAGAKRQIERKRDGGNVVKGSYTAISRKSYLAHSEFLVAIETDHAPEWLAALRDPTFMTYLGRKSCAPSFPFILGVWDGDVTDLFDRAPCAVTGYNPVSGLRSYAIEGDYDTHVEIPAQRLHRPDATNREDYLSWAATHLAR